MRSAEGLVVLKRFLLSLSDLIFDSRIDSVSLKRSNSCSCKTRKRAMSVSTPLSNAVYRKGCLLRRGLCSVVNGCDAPRHCHPCRPHRAGLAPPGFRENSPIFSHLSLRVRVFAHSHTPA